MKIDPIKAAARVAQLGADSQMHSQVAAVLRDLADDEERQARRCDIEAAKVQELLNESEWEEPRAKS